MLRRFFPFRLRTCHSFTGCQAFVPQKRGRTFADYGGSLARKTAHFRRLRHTFGNCGALSHTRRFSTTAARTRLRVQQGTLCCVFKCSCGVFVVFFLTRTVCQKVNFRKKRGEIWHVLADPVTHNMYSTASSYSLSSPLSILPPFFKLTEKSLISKESVS